MGICRTNFLCRAIDDLYHHPAAIGVQTELHHRRIRRGNMRFWHCGCYGDGRALRAVLYVLCRLGRGVYSRFHRDSGGLSMGF